MTTTQKERSFRLGDPVRVPLGRRKLTGVIVEERGPIGMGGRRLFQVSIPMDPFEPMLVELPEDEIEPGAGEAESLSLDRDKIAAYLSNGGLVSILRSNLSGGRSQPRVWLRPDQLGNVTHTFVPERGVVGGDVVPSGALHGDKIFTPRRNQVLGFIESFGLDRQEAGRIISEVGMSQ